MIHYLVAGTLLAAPAVQGDVTTLLGARTAPEAALQLPTHPEDHFEPAGLGAIIANASIDGENGAWAHLELQGWFYTPEPEADAFKATPSLGWSYTKNEHWQADIAARFSVEALPWLSDASNSRREVTGRAKTTRQSHTFGFQANTIARNYPAVPEWRFRATELGVTWLMSSKLIEGLHLGAEAAGQVNQGYTANGTDAEQGLLGSQLRLGVTAMWTSNHLQFDLNYKLYLAEDGEGEDIVRPQFSYMGDYTDDADALSLGGFTQHRLYGAITWQQGPWSAQLNILGRLRLVDDESTYARTLNGQLSARRQLNPRWSALSTVGVGTISLIRTPGYTDVYGWLGLSRSLSR